MGSFFEKASVDAGTGAGSTVDYLEQLAGASYAEEVWWDLPVSELADKFREVVEESVTVGLDAVKLAAERQSEPGVVRQRDPRHAAERRKRVLTMRARRQGITSAAQALLTMLQESGEGGADQAAFDAAALDFPHALEEPGFSASGLRDALIETGMIERAQTPWEPVPH